MDTISPTSKTQAGWPEAPDREDLPLWAWFYSQILGWEIFPLQPGGKRPLVDVARKIGHNGVKGASNDLYTVTSWWWDHPDANIGLACGDLAVLDLDGEVGIGNWKKHFPERLTTLASVTGGGGWHLFYLVPGGRIARNSASKIAPKVDVRGEGGYVVLPPSLHESGLTYKWCEWRAPAMAQDKILEPLEKERPNLPKTPLGAVKYDSGDGSSYGVRAMQFELDHVLAARKGTRNNALNVAAMNIGSLVAGGYLTETFAAEHLKRAAYVCWESSGDVPPKGEIERTIRSGMSEGYTRPRRAKG